LLHQATLSSMKDWYVIHSEGESILYYGYYRSTNDPKDKKESDRAKADHAAIDKIVDAAGEKLFSHSFFVEVNSPDPSAPPEWDLRKAPGFWSVEIAVYKDSPQRKQAAVDSVRDARKQGVEAYYYHGPTASSVCIGSWPKDAVREEVVRDDPGDPGRIVAPDSKHDVVVLPQPLDPGMQIRNRDGEQVRELTPRTEIVDPSLLATMAKYPNHAVNGDVFVDRVPDPTTPGKTIEVPKQSVLVPIPHETASLLRQDAPPPTMVAPTTPSATPGAGKLKSIGQ